MTLRPGVGFYVWQDTPTADAMDGYDWALVRAANGNGTTNPAGFDFKANFAAWRAKFGGGILPWTYLYPSSDGRVAADALLGAAGQQALYQCDLEDAVPPATISAFVDRLHAQAPGCKVIFDSYPTRAQFVRVTGSAATWDRAVEKFDGFNPQVYYASQFDDGWENEFVGKPILPSFSPANVADWTYFQRKLEEFGTVALWRYPSSKTWSGKLTATGGEPVILGADDISAIVAAVHADLAKMASDSTHTYWPPIHNKLATLTSLVQAEGDETQAAIAAIQSGNMDAQQIADLVIAGVGSEVATDVADIISQRMAS